ncbi:MAG: hypothetical protein OHK93_000095 [Ramalina farinacea]|uniref:Ribosomal protein S2 n=1 Tax=Ramalina farinacea TaxID=258253 RepID=A0AA43QHI2_9LECA|nr:hypothetical protein [Ramalina farinacea]
MIVRKALIRHGRRLAHSPRQWTRSLATETDLHDLQDTTEAIDSSLSNATLQTKSIESQAEKSGVQYVPQIDARTQMSQQLLGDGTKYVYDRHRRQQKLQNPLGTTVDKGYQPHRLLTDPPRPSDITLELLLASQAHLGHKTSHWNPANSRYIFGIRQGIHIISLDVTAAHLRRACRVVSSVAERGGLILFVGTRPGQDRCVVTAATMAGGCHLFDRWTPGSITNGDQILRSCRKQVVDEFDREVPEQGAALKDASALKPDLVVCMNPIENWVMLHECGMHGVPTIGIIDTDANPTWVTYPIPANDDSLRCVQVIAGALGRAGQEGQANRREAALAGEVTYRPNRPKRIADRMNASPRAVEAATGLANTGDSGMGPAADGVANRSRNSEVDKNLGYHRAELAS